MTYKSLRPLTEEEERRLAKKLIVPGYIKARHRVVPFDEMGEGDTLFIENCTPSIIRSVYRMLGKRGCVVSRRVEGAETLFEVSRVRSTEEMAPKQDYGAATRFKRPWDRLASIPELEVIRARRKDPDGRMYKVKTLVRGKETIRKFPWDDMTMDGDFFIVPAGLKSKSLLTSLRESAARRDWEIQIVPWVINDEGEEVEGFRVTRIRTGLEALKRRLNQVTGKHNPIGIGRRSTKATVRQVTLDRRVVEAMLKAQPSLTRENAAGEWERIAGRAMTLAGNNKDGWASVPEKLKEQKDGIQGQSDAERHDSSSQVRGVPPEVEHRDVEAPVDDGGTVEPSGERVEGSDGQGEQRTQADARHHPAPVFGPGATGELDVDDEDAEALVVDTSGMTAEQLEGSAYSPDYDRAAILRERLAKWGAE